VRPEGLRQVLTGENGHDREKSVRAKHSLFCDL
jgi:hypothetical protein